MTGPRKFNKIGIKLFDITLLRTGLAKQGGMTMSRTIRVRFSKGLIEPLEKIDIGEGKEITVTIMEVPSRQEIMLLKNLRAVGEGPSMLRS